MTDKTFDHPRTTDVKPAVPVDVPKMDTAFTALGLSDALAFGVQEMGYVTPTPIQAQAIPVVLKGGDDEGLGAKVSNGDGALVILIDSALGLLVEDSLRKNGGALDGQLGDLKFGGVGGGGVSHGGVEIGVQGERSAKNGARRLVEDEEMGGELAKAGEERRRE